MWFLHFSPTPALSGGGQPELEAGNPTPTRGMTSLGANMGLIYSSPLFLVHPQADPSPLVLLQEEGPPPEPQTSEWPGMFSLMGGGLLCAVSGLILLIVATATDFWMQYRYSGNLSNQGLWRFCVGSKCHPHTITLGKGHLGIWTQKLNGHAG